MDETHHGPAAHDIFDHEPSGQGYLHLWREVILTYRQMMRRMAAETGYNGAQFEVLRQLAVSGGRSTVSVVARDLAVDPAAVTRLVAELTGLGLVGREQDPRDGRRRPVVLTTEGRRRMGAIHESLHRYETALTLDMDGRDLDTAMRVLSSMRAAVDALPARRPRPDRAKEPPAS